MVIQYLRNEKTFNNIIDNCKEYIEQEIDDVQQSKYQKQLSHILDNDNPGIRWARLIGSGLFEDCEGKVVEIDEMSVYVETDY